jgi:hypothetical protein
MIYCPLYLLGNTPRSFILFTRSAGVVLPTEPVFVNVYGAQESITPGWESIPELLKRVIQVRAQSAPTVQRRVF